jgi:hypothetical protein
MEESITLADIWGSNPSPDNRSSSDQHQHSHLNNQAGSDFLQIDQWPQNQTGTADQGLSGDREPDRQLADWTSVERAPDGTRSRPSNYHRLALEEVLLRDTAVYMISLYFDYVGALENVLPPRLTQYRSTL